MVFLLYKQRGCKNISWIKWRGYTKLSQQFSLNIQSVVLASQVEAYGSEYPHLFGQYGPNRQPAQLRGLPILWEASSAYCGSRWCTWYILLYGIPMLVHLKCDKIKLYSYHGLACSNFRSWTFAISSFNSNFVLEYFHISDVTEMNQVGISIPWHWSLSCKVNVFLNWIYVISYITTVEINVLFVILYRIYARLNT